MQYESCSLETDPSKAWLQVVFTLKLPDQQIADKYILLENWTGGISLFQMFSQKITFYCREIFSIKQN